MLLHIRLYCCYNRYVHMTDFAKMQQNFMKE